MRFCHKCVCGMNVCGIACENAHLTMRKRAIKKAKECLSSALLFSFVCCVSATMKNVMLLHKSKQGNLKMVSKNNMNRV